jgi:hypothetical protein
MLLFVIVISTINANQRVHAGLHDDERYSERRHDCPPLVYMWRTASATSRSGTHRRRALLLMIVLVTLRTCGCSGRTGDGWSGHPIRLLLHAILIAAAARILPFIWCRRR